MDATPPKPTRPRRPPPPSASTVARRLRSRLPVSPLPWHWGRRLRRLALIAAVVAVVAGAVASILLQGESSAPSRGANSANLSPEVERALNGMSPGEKADAVLIAGFDDPDREVKDLSKGELGGVLVTGDAWPGAARGKALTAELRAAGSSGGRVPPFIVAEQEGGKYRTLPDLPPGQSELQVGDAGDLATAENWAYKMGKALKSQGFDLNLAPVADVATLDSVIADRAFGDDPEIVAQLTAAAVRGCNRSGIACAVSHFPGLGGASEDTALGPATVGLDPSSLEARDLLPFEAAVKARVPAVLLSLAFYAAYDPVTPGALSPAVSDELLRKTVGFQGVAISDDLSSGAIAAGSGAPEAAQSALAAGADMVVVSDPADARATRQALIKAVDSGAISSDRIDQAVARVLALKQHLGILPGRG